MKQLFSVEEMWEREDSEQLRYGLIAGCQRALVPVRENSEMILGFRTLVL